MISAGQSMMHAQRLPVASKLLWRAVRGQQQAARPQHNARVAVLPQSSVPAATESMQDVLLRSLSANKEIAVLVVDGKNLVQEAVQRHKMAPTAAVAFGRALLGTMMLGVFRKDQETVQITFKSEGPLGGIFVIADSEGNVRGRVGNPECDLPLNAMGNSDVRSAVGSGVLAVVRSHPTDKQPYTGMVPISSGEIAQDLTQYLAESEQQNSALGLGVTVRPDGTVGAAGGFFVQVLPFASDETLDQLEQNITGMPAINDLLDMGATPARITEMLLYGLGTAEGSVTVTPRYGPCDAQTLRNKFVRALASLGRQEVEQMIEEDGQIEISCDLCNDRYTFYKQDVDSIFVPAASSSSSGGGGGSNGSSSTGS